MRRRNRPRAAIAGLLARQNNVPILVDARAVDKGSEHQGAGIDAAEVMQRARELTEKHRVEVERLCSAA